MDNWTSPEMKTTFTSPRWQHN